MPERRIRASHPIKRQIVIHINDYTPLDFERDDLWKIHQEVQQVLAKDFEVEVLRVEVKEER